MKTNGRMTAAHAVRLVLSYLILRLTGYRTRTARRELAKRLQRKLNIEHWERLGWRSENGVIIVKTGVTCTR